MRNFSNYIKEENKINKEFISNHIKDINKISKLFINGDKLIKTTSKKLKKENNPDYTILILSQESNKSFINSFRSASIGYLGDADSLLRKCLDSIIHMLYLYKHPYKIEEWIENGRIKKNNSKHWSSIEDLTKKVAQKYKDEKIFKGFDIKKLLYEIGYKKSCGSLHLDFKCILDEITIYDSPQEQNLQIGPRYDQSKSNIFLSRIIFYIFLQQLFLINNLKYYDREKETKNILKILEYN